MTNTQAARDAIMLCLTLERKDGTPVQSWALADTGSAAHFISRRLVEELGRVDDIEKKSDDLTDISDCKIPVTEEISLKVKVGHQQREFTLQFDILEHGETALLGLGPFLQRAIVLRVERLLTQAVGEPFLYDAHAIKLNPEFTNQPTLELLGGKPKPHRHCYFQGRKYFPPPPRGLSICKQNRPNLAEDL